MKTRGSLNLLATGFAMAVAGVGCASSQGASEGPIPSAAPCASGIIGGAASGPVGVASGATAASGASSPPPGLISPCGTFVDPGLRPVFGTTVTAATTPPPISGGTLMVLRDGVTAVASDPDRDAVYIVNSQSGTLTHTVSLQQGDEPGRLVEDGAGQVQVALRSGGALVTIDPVLGTVTTRRAVCPAPRGLAWDSTSDSVWVACATGELAALPAVWGSGDDELDDRARSARRHCHVTVRSPSRSSGRLKCFAWAAQAPLLAATSCPKTAHSQPHVAWRAVEGPSQQRGRGPSGALDAEHSNPRPRRLRLQRAGRGGSRVHGARPGRERYQLRRAQ
jgi:hypothetical protein